MLHDMAHKDGVALAGAFQVMRRLYCMATEALRARSIWL